MAVIRDGNTPVLLVVDVQVGVMQGTWNAPEILEKISRAVAKARNQDVPVIWVQHADGELVYGSPEWQLVPGLSPMNSEVVIHKQYNSSFEQTTLEKHLDRLGVSHIVLAGAATNWCIRATAYAALDRGYDLTLLQDAHTTETIEFEDGTRIEAMDIIRELNIALTWLSYPGRTTGTAAVDLVDFYSPRDTR